MCIHERGFLRNDLKSNNVVIDGSENKPVRGADPGFFLGGGALVSCPTSTPINHMVFFFAQNTSYFRKPQVISEGGGGAHPLHPPPRSARVSNY